MSGWVERKVRAGSEDAVLWAAGWGGPRAFSWREPRRRAGGMEPDLTQELTGALWWLQREQLVRDLKGR